MKYEKTILVTGGLGFIGSAFLRENAPLYPKWLFVNLDDYREGAHDEAVESVCMLHNYKFVRCALEKGEAIRHLFDQCPFTDVLHFAADSNVDHSIKQPLKTYESNVLGTLNLLEAVRVWNKVRPIRFLYVSTDEVYGPNPNSVAYLEKHPLNPTNPYSASKAAAEHLVMSYKNTFGVDAIITRGVNTFGPWQTETKLVPRSVALLKSGYKIELYGAGEATREWIPLECHVGGIFIAWRKGVSGEAYNIGTNVEFSGKEIAWIILSSLGLPDNKLQFIKDRPGHDMRYSIDHQKIQQLGWDPLMFNTKDGVKLAMASTARWLWTNGKDPVK
jgi:dTDP-glucose 4,6-dehydratase